MGYPAADPEIDSTRRSSRSYCGERYRSAQTTMPRGGSMIRNSSRVRARHDPSTRVSC